MVWLSKFFETLRFIGMKNPVIIFNENIKYL